MPGVSMSTTCASGRLTIPKMRLRVVCGTGVTMETFSPTSALTNVLLPAFGRPTTATNPDFIGAILISLPAAKLPPERFAWSSGRVTDPAEAFDRYSPPGEDQRAHGDRQISVT